jgi:hypothetical protein
MTYALPWRYSTTELKGRVIEYEETNLYIVCNKNSIVVNPI